MAIPIQGPSHLIECRSSQSLGVDAMQKDHGHICPCMNYLFGQVTIIRRFAFYTTTLMRELASEKATALTRAVHSGVLRYIVIGMNLNIKGNKGSK